jgi:UrcA family protein
MTRSALLALAIALLASGADARPRHILSMARVEVGDLDLATDAGAAAMVQRLNAAASALCDTPRSPLFPRQQAEEWRCRRAAVGSAVERLATSALTTAFNAWLSAGPDAAPQARIPG